MMEKEILRKDESGLKSFKEPQNPKKAVKSARVLISKGLNLKFSSYLWQYILDFLDDYSFYQIIPLVSKYFMSIIGER
jgi:ubiquinone/menaquinone biosynthesis C-methylase UbiE